MEHLNARIFSRSKIRPLSCGENNKLNAWNIKFYLEQQGHPTKVCYKAWKTLFRLSRVPLIRSLEKHSKRRYKILFCSAILGELESFQNYKGFSISFPKILGAIYRFPKVRIFLIALSITFQNPKSYRCPFSTTNRQSVTQVVKHQKLNVRKSQGIYQIEFQNLHNMKGSFIQKFLAFLKQKEILGYICFFEQIFYPRWVPLIEIGRTIEGKIRCSIRECCHQYETRFIRLKIYCDKN